MPLYEYRCATCKEHTVEEIGSFSDPSEKFFKCPICAVDQEETDETAKWLHVRTVSSGTSFRVNMRRTSIL